MGFKRRKAYDQVKDPGPKRDGKEEGGGSTACSGASYTGGSSSNEGVGGEAARRRFAGTCKTNSPQGRNGPECGTVEAPARPPGASGAQRRPQHPAKFPSRHIDRHKT